MYQQLYSYNNWANQKIISVAKKLPMSQLTTPTVFGHHNLWETLIHLLAAEVLWRRRCQSESPTSLLSEADFDGWEALESRWAEERHTMQRYLAGLRAEQFNETVAYKTTKGVPHQQKLGELLHHLLLHGMQHRSEIAAMLTQYGQPPGDIDYLVYLRQLT